MKFIKSNLADVIIIEPQVHGDHRGFFMETWRKDVFSAHGIEDHFVQDNHSKSTRGILRGLHYQVKQTQGKLVRVLSGEIYDVAVDLRHSSAYFGSWVGVILSAQNKRQLWVPGGFAHGFLVTSNEAEVVYKCTDYYAPEYERSLLWNDPSVAIDWPLNGNKPILSAKDEKGELLKESKGFL